MEAKALFCNITNALEKLGLASDAPTWCAMLDRAQNSSKVEILVMGEFNHGKSSLINMMIGRKVLKTGLIPTTQVETSIGFGAPEDSAIIYYKDGTEQRFALNALEEDTTDDVERIEVELSGSQFDSAALFVDTPGLNEAHALRETYVSALMERASLVIFMLDASQPATRSEMEQLESWCRSLGDTPRLVAVNKCDRLDSDEFEEVREYVIKLLSNILSTEDIFFVSAKKSQYPGNSLLIDRIRQTIELRRTKVAKSAIARVINIIEGRLRALLWFSQAIEALPEMHLRRLAARIQDVHIESPEKRRNIIQSVISALNNKIFSDLNTFEKDFLTAMEREIEKASIEDVEEYFGCFVHAEFGSWVRAKQTEMNESICNLLQSILFDKPTAESTAFCKEAANRLPMPDTAHLLIASLHENAKPQDDHEIKLEKLVKLPGIYQYRVENAKKREAKRISHCKCILHDALKSDIDNLSLALERLASQSSLELQNHLAGLIEHRLSKTDKQPVESEEIMNDIMQIRAWKGSLENGS